MELAPATLSRLVAAARNARIHAYAPYSQFLVGAAVLVEDGRIFQGCNVENASYGLSMCAERNAAAAARAAGGRPVAVAIVASTDFTPPCGACRQVLAEFDPGMPVVLAESDGDGLEVVSLVDLLPRSFRLGPRNP